MKSSVFSTSSYKEFMERSLTGAENRGQLSRAAEFLNCQRSYISRVISEGLQLTPDHAFQLTLFWKMTSTERDYFLALVDHERASTPELRAFVQSRIQEMKHKHESIQERTERKSYALESSQIGYFSSWTWSAIHFLTSVPEFQTVPALAKRLRLSDSLVEGSLKQLQSMGFVEEKNRRWIYKSGEFHAPKDSPLVLLHHQNWRSRAVLDAQELSDESLHYTTVQTMSRADAERIKQIMLDFITESSRIAGPSEAEEAYVVLCDLFKA